MLQDVMALITVCCHICEKHIIYANPDIHVKLSAKNSKFPTPEIFRDS